MGFKRQLQQYAHNIQICTSIEAIIAQAQTGSSLWWAFCVDEQWQFWRDL